MVIICVKVSVTSKKLPNVYKSYPKMISLENWKILTPLQKLPNSVGKIIVATDFEKSCPVCNKSPNMVTLLMVDTYLSLR